MLKNVVLVFEGRVSEMLLPIPKCPPPYTPILYFVLISSLDCLLCLISVHPTDTTAHLAWQQPQTCSPHSSTNYPPFTPPTPNPSNKPPSRNCSSIPPQPTHPRSLHPNISSLRVTLSKNPRQTFQNRSSSTHLSDACTTPLNPPRYSAVFLLKKPKMPRCIKWYLWVILTPRWRVGRLWEGVSMVLALWFIIMKRLRSVWETGMEYVFFLLLFSKLSIIDRVVGGAVCLCRVLHHQFFNSSWNPSTSLPQWLWRRGSSF